MNDNKRILNNTVIVYVQLVLNTLIGLLAVRFVLQALGEEDYGIYMLVGGVIGMLNFLTGSMSQASTRFMAYSLGKKDLNLSLRTFNTTLYIHLLLCLIVIAIMEVGGWIMFEWMLNIPENKMTDAIIVYQFMVFSTIVSIISVPYEAVITSHENMMFLSIVTILYSLVTLGIGLYLLNYDGNRLLLYGAVVSINSFISLSLKYIYSKKHYVESDWNLKKYKDKGLFKDILSFTGWNLVSFISIILATQIRGVFINMFFGVRLNAGEGLAKRVNAQVNQVSTGITYAITPQMTKSESKGDRSRLLSLTHIGVKYTTYMFALIALPIAFEAHFIFKIWLGTIPSYAVLFTQLIIISQFVSKLTWQIGNAINSVGDIKYFRIFTSVFYILCVIFMYLVLYAGGSPAMVFVVDIITNILLGVLNLYFGKKIVSIEPLRFIKDTTLPVVIPLLISTALVYPIYHYMDEGWIRLFVFFASFMIVYSCLFLIMGTSKEERLKLRALLPIKQHE